MPKQWLAIAVIVVAVIAGYSPVLFNFFAGDDFVHLEWLAKAVHNPELILRNFHSSWLDINTARFYRPLISIFMVVDYLLWGTNGLGFHITNLGFHLASTVLLFFIMRRLARQFNDDGSILMPASAAAIFGLYPLHTEAVSWITGRVDAIVTTFYLASMWCYIWYRQSTAAGRLPARPAWLAGSLVAMLCALLSKEMAIMLPPTLVALEVFVFQQRNIVERKLKNVIVHTLKYTCAFWLLLGAYLVARTLALGTFIGGYDNSMTIADPESFARTWIHACRMLLVPLNKTIAGVSTPLAKVWPIPMFLVICFAAYHAISRQPYRWIGAFLFSWLVLSLVPVYKIFAISDDLQGSRLAYLATVPLSAFLALAFVPARFRKFSDLGCIAFSALTFFGLLWNNQAWAEAGKESNAIRAGLEKVYSSLKDDPQVLLVGLPDQLDGAYVLRNAFPGITETPQFSRDVHNCLMINSVEPVLPFGYCKESLLAAGDRVHIYGWNFAEGFTPLHPDKRTYAGEKFTYRSGGKGSFEFFFGSLPCFTTDFVKVHYPENKRMNPEAWKIPVFLEYSNNLVAQFDPRYRVASNLDKQNGPQDLIFSLRSVPSWAFGGDSHGFRLVPPDGVTANSANIEILSASALMPSISFPNSGYLGRKGFIHLTRSHRSETITADATKVPGATGVVFEITNPNQWFPSQNTNSPTPTMTEMQLPHTTGSITLDRKIFPTVGLYEGRAWAVDKDGTRLGVAGDHIVIAVDS